VLWFIYDYQVFITLFYFPSVAYMFWGGRGGASMQEEDVGLLNFD
jgi:hypothetical protein